MATKEEVEEAVAMLQAELTRNGPAIAKILDEFDAPCPKCDGNLADRHHRATDGRRLDCGGR